MSAAYFSVWEATDEQVQNLVDAVRQPLDEVRRGGATVSWHTKTGDRAPDEADLSPRQQLVEFAQQLAASAAEPNADLAAAVASGRASAGRDLLEFLAGMDNL